MEQTKSKKPKKLTDDKLRKIARLTIAIHSMDFASGGLEATDIGLSEDEFEILMTEMQRVSERLAGNNRTNFASVGEVVKYIRDGDK